MSEEEEKLQKIKETVDEAIVLIQRKLNLLSQELRETESMEVAIDIARRVRTARKVLYGEAMTRQASLMITPSQLQQQLKDQTGLIAAPATVSIVKATGQRTGIAPFNLISGVHSDQGRRRTNEDRHMIIEDIRVCCPSISGSGNWAYFAVYDGHGGACSSKILQDVLHTRIVSHSDFVRNVSTALRCGFEEAEKIILQRGTSEGFKDGSTAAVAIIHDTCLTIANLGDSEIVLARQYASILLYLSINQLINLK